MQAFVMQASPGQAAAQQRPAVPDAATQCPLTQSAPLLSVSHVCPLIFFFTHCAFRQMYPSAPLQSLPEPQLVGHIPVETVHR
jgi:hypothetical protein